MAITTPLHNEVASIVIDEITDDVATDFSSLTLGATVYDSVNRLIFKKDLNGVRQDPFTAVASMQVVTSSATVTPNANNDDGVDITAQAVNLTLAAPSGTPFNGQFLTIDILDNSTTRTLTYNAIYVVADGVTLPTDTVSGKLLTIYCRFKNSVWMVTGTVNEA